MSSWVGPVGCLPRLSLVTDPTPLTLAPRLSATLGGPQFWFKRDDLVPVAFGGNKVRSLDFLVADALRQGADTLVTGAGPLSNHVRAVRRGDGARRIALCCYLLGRGTGADRGKPLANTAAWSGDKVYTRP